MYFRVGVSDTNPSIKTTYSVTSDNKKNAIFDVVKKLASLYIDNVRLTSAEKLTIFLSGVALFSIVIILAMIAMIFIAIGLASMLEEYIAPFWSYFIIAAVILLIIGLLFLLKTPLFVNPIARFISKLLLTPPKKQ